MSRSTGIVRRAGLHASWFVRGLWPTRKVVRQVQGVELVLPWSHRLPDYARSSPEYGQNLVRLSAALAAIDGRPLTMVDVGANVGDSALQVLNATDGQVLCVEGDEYYLDFLHANADADDRIVIEESLIVTDGSESLSAVRSGGTTRFEDVGATTGVATISPERLRASYPQFDELRLIKSDTDGWDVTLIPALASAWRPATPVLFLEYDPRLSQIAGNDALAFWPAVEALGYDSVGVWDNGGRAVGRFTVDQMPEKTTVLDRAIAANDYQYWDVAVVHRDDSSGREALDSLF